ncbi:NADPH oxidase 5-like [Ylistrum balloti]|uniref:NADPH oxidase 5-like n=1 Tax=Ylistrum balloti TaxID=509963 RepID=UPI002905BC48|nr:NADPH oxidase 5-like [Ylistrum balloti]
MIIDHVPIEEASKSNAEEMMESYSGTSKVSQTPKHLVRIDVTSGVDNLAVQSDVEGETEHPVHVNYYLSNGDRLWKPKFSNQSVTANQNIFNSFSFKRYLPVIETSNPSYSFQRPLQNKAPTYLVHKCHPVVTATDIPKSDVVPLTNMADIQGLSYSQTNPAFSDSDEKQQAKSSSKPSNQDPDVKIDVDQIALNVRKHENDNIPNEDSEMNTINTYKNPPTAQISPIISSPRPNSSNGDSIAISITDGRGQGQVVDSIRTSSPSEENFSGGNGEILNGPGVALKEADDQQFSEEDAKWLAWIEQQFTTIAGEDGEISLEEFKDALKVKKSFFAERFFALFDQDRSGSIELHELMDGLRMLTKGTPAQKLRFLFDVYDVDGSGTIDRDELKTVLMSCTEESSLSISEENMDALTDILFDSADEDNSGAISFDELKAELEKHPGVLENLTISAAQWLKPPAKNKNKRRTRYCTYAYIRNNLKKVVFLILYFLVSIGLGAYAAYNYRNSNGFIIVARICGMNLNFNCMFILVLMLRKSITYLLMTRVAKYLPLEQNILFHKMVGWMIGFYSLFHTLAHVGNAILLDISKPDLALWEIFFTTRAGYGWVYGTAILSGWALDIILVVMIICSLEFVRRGGHFQVFYNTHMLYILFWILLIIHGSNFWKWFVGPGVIFILEKLLRSKLIKKARYGDTYIEEVNLLPSGVTHLVISRPEKFRYKAGDYVFIQIPAIAKQEWHPFTISSAPEMKGHIWLHVRSAGHWTNKCYKFFENLDTEREKGKSVVRVPLQKRKSRHIGIEGKIKMSRTGNIEIELEEESEMRRKEKKKAVRIQCYIDGPYGTATREIYETEHAVLVGAGIGITPMASILQSVMYRYKSSLRTCPHCNKNFYGDIPETTMKLKKVDFVWVNRDQKAFEWFVSLLTQLEIDQAEIETCGGAEGSNRIIDMHMFMTAAQKKTDMKGIGLQMALDLMHKKENKDMITGLRTKTEPGRPNWGKLFGQIMQEDRGKIKVFFCGAPALGKTIKEECEKLKIAFSKENF